MGKLEKKYIWPVKSPCLTLLVLRNADLNNISKNWQWCGEMTATLEAMKF